MPLVTGTTTLSGSTQLIATATPVYHLWILAPANQITVGKSNVATVGITVAGAATFQIGPSLGTFNLTEVYVKGTDAQVVQWLAVAH